MYSAAVQNKANAKHLILDLLLAVRDRPLPVRDAVCAAALFGISENHLRVTLARLCAANLVEATERGAYRLGAAATSLAGDVATWRQAEERLRVWSGDYIAVHCTVPRRSKRTASGQRQRALQMLGFRALQPGLFVRPNNIEPDVDTVRQRLYALGLERTAVVFLGAAFDSQTEVLARTLWDGAALNANYRSRRVALLQWLDRHDELDTPTAARESFFLGGQAIRDIVYDPLLPEPLVDATERHWFIDSVKRFDAAGQAIWVRFFEAIGSGVAHAGMRRTQRSAPPLAAFP